MLLSKNKQQTPNVLHFHAAQQNSFLELLKTIVYTLVLRYDENSVRHETDAEVGLVLA